jgi:hypothetical protein
VSYVETNPYYLRRRYRLARTLVYFVQAEHGGPIKIGSAYRPLDRVRCFQPWSPYQLLLLAVMPGAKREEFALHQQFEKDRLHGEWFEPSEELLGIIRQATGPPFCVVCGHPVLEEGEECSDCAPRLRTISRNGAIRMQRNHTMECQP